MPNKILRFGPWSNNNNYRFFAHNKPVVLPDGKLDIPKYIGWLDGLPKPVNPGMNEWNTTNEPWESLSIVSGYANPQLWTQDYDHYSDTINTTRTATAVGSIALVSMGFFYQATEDFTIDWNFTMSSLLGFGSYGWDTGFVTADDPQNLQAGDSYTYQGANQTGIDTITCTAGVIGYCYAYVDNFGSDYPGDTASGKFTHTPTPP